MPDPTAYLASSNSREALSALMMKAAVPSELCVCEIVGSQVEEENEVNANSPRESHSKGSRDVRDSKRLERQRQPRERLYVRPLQRNRTRSTRRQPHRAALESAHDCGVVVLLLV